MASPNNDIECPVPVKKVNTRGFVRPRKYNSKYKLAEANDATAQNSVLLPEYVEVEAEPNNVASTEDNLEYMVQDTTEAESGSLFGDAHHVQDDINSGNIEIGTDMSASTIGDRESSGIENPSDVDYCEQIKKLLHDVRCYNVFQPDDENEPDDTELLGSDEDESEEEWDENETSDDPVITEEEPNMQDEPIYRGHSMPVHVSMLLILLYVTTHSITGVQFIDLLTLISVHCLDTHPGLKSVFHYKKYFSNLKSPLVKHHYCTNCLCIVEENDTACRLCQQDLLTAKAKSYFIEIPIEKQIQNMFQRSDFVKLLGCRFSRKKKNENNIEDIYDGELYKKLSKCDGPLSQKYPYNISLTWNTDGIPIFKSSKYSIWPMYFVINELPFRFRIRKENMIFCGLWFGESKPFMSTFTQPMNKSLENLEKNGIEVTVEEKQHVCKAFLICGTADLPAKSLVMNMNQFNGACSCQKCLQPGETFRTSKGGTIHVFPYDKDCPYGPPRTHSSSIEDAFKAVETGTTANGIKGPSFLMGHVSYDYVKSTTIDYMHCVCLGITKLLMKLWFTSTFSKEAFSLSAYTDVVDRRLLKIKPPSFITRIPRTVSSHIKYWKASELRSWLFYYSLPILSDVMLESYFSHFASFVEAIYLLNGESISTSDIEKSEMLLNYFVCTFGTLYGERYTTLNLHLLLHLSQCVRDIGPIWTYSCFPFENANGVLTRLFHGTQNIDMQIVSAVNINHLLPSLIESISEEYKMFVDRLCPKLGFKYQSGTPLFLGRGYCKELSPEIFGRLLSILKLNIPNITCYNRLVLRGNVYHSKDYTRVKKRNSYTIQYFCSSTSLLKFGHVNFYGKHVPNCDCDSTDCPHTKSFAFITPLAVTHETLFSSENTTLSVSSSHVHITKPASALEIVEIDKLLCVCVCVELPDDNRVFVYRPANTLEKD